MRPLPTPPSPGKPVSATLIRQLIDAIRERTILPGLNTSVKRSPNGTVVNAAASAVSAAVPSAPHPWKVFAADEEDDYLFSVYAPEDVFSFGGTQAKIGGMTQVEDDEGHDVPGYFSLDNVDGESGGYVWLVGYVVPDDDDETVLVPKAKIVESDAELDLSALEEDSPVVISSTLVATVEIIEGGVGKVRHQVLTYNPTFSRQVYI